MYTRFAIIAVAFSALFVFSARPSYAQVAPPQIQSVSWYADPGLPEGAPGWNAGTSTTDISLTAKGKMNTVPNPLPYYFKMKYGFPGDYTVGASGNATIQEGFWSSVTSVFNSNEHINANSEFSIPVYSLWPASNYFVDIHEISPLGTIDTPLHNYMILTTDKIQSLNVAINSQSGGGYSITAAINAGSNMYNQGNSIIQGMPVAFYFLSQNHSGQDILAVPQSDIVWGGTASFSQIGGLVMNVPPGTLNTTQDYYLKLVNDQPGAGGLTLLDTDLLIDLNNSNQTTTTNPGQQGGSLLGGSELLTTEEDFSNGLITCNGIDEDPNDGVDEHCSFEKLLLLVNKVINFLIFVIGVPIVALTFAYAGFVLVTSGGNSAKKGEAKTIIGKGITGLIIMLAAWLLIRTVLLVLGYEGPLLGILGV